MTEISEHEHHFVELGVDWLGARPPLTVGGRIEERRTAPRPGWYICGRYHSVGPFGTAGDAQRYANAGR